MPAQAQGTRLASSRLASLLALLITAGSAQGCASSADAPRSQAPSPAAQGVAAEALPAIGPAIGQRVDGAPDGKQAASSEAPLAQVYTTVDDADAMRALEKSGARFGLLVSQRWQEDIFASLRAELRVIGKADPGAGVGIRGHAHRMFNERWLHDGEFELIGLTYRTERIAVDAARCGDVRLVYRLAYRTEVSGQAVHSRLPMTVLVELAGRERDPVRGCAEEAKRWIREQPASGEEISRFLLSNALRDRLVPEQVTQILVNAQVVRWPSSVRPSLGGHAEYSMLAFAPDDTRTRLRAKLLENMPDLERLKGQPALRAQLISWIGEHLDELDEGSAILPDAFLAKRALSVTPRGLSRRSNRPYRQLFRASDFSSLPLEGRRRIASPEALLRRLDDMSCVGCHQSRTIAGFHWLGVDGAEVAAGNALYVSRSVPLLADSRRRARYALQLAKQEQPDFSRPFAERDDDDGGLVGSRCGLGDPGFASWTCAEGLVCDRYDAPTDDAIVGVCTNAGAAGQGDFCEAGALSATSDPHRDRSGSAPERACASGVCNINRTGFPGGMCTSSCSDMPADGSCGVIAVLTPFNNCLARKTPFPQCLAEHVSPAGLRACDESHPCRDDYVCATTPEGAGGCMPPYFLFQLRVDGHP